MCKAMMRYHYTLIRAAKIKKIAIIPNADEDVEKLYLSYLAGGTSLYRWKRKMVQSLIHYMTWQFLKVVSFLKITW